MSILDQEASCGFDYVSGTGDLALAVNKNYAVKLISARAPTGSSATMTIVPGGPGQRPALGGGTITIVAGGGFDEEYRLGQVGGSTVITITGSASYYISFFVLPGGPA